MKPSARSGSSKSTLFACCDFNHCCSRSVTLFSMLAFFCAYNNVAPKKTRASTHEEIILFTEPPSVGSLRGSRHGEQLCQFGFRSEHARNALCCTPAPKTQRQV